MIALLAIFREWGAVKHTFKSGKSLGNSREPWGILGVELGTLGSLHDQSTMGPG